MGKIKRKAGNIGFQAHEIAFIENEMVALAEAYGLQVENDIAHNVEKRKRIKSSRKRRQDKITQDSSSNNVSTISIAYPQIQLLLPSSKPESYHTLALHILKYFVPEDVSIGKCLTPGCGCMCGPHTEYHVDTKRAEELRIALPSLEPGKKSKRQSTEDILSTSGPLLRVMQCNNCKHGIFQHSLKQTSHPGTRWITGQGLCNRLYQLLRLLRVCASSYINRMWTTEAISLLSSFAQQLRKALVAQEIEGTMERGLVNKTIETMSKIQKVIQVSAWEEVAIRIACLADNLYFETYYTTIVLYGRQCGAVPNPAKYFTDLQLFTPEGHKILQEYLIDEIAETVPMLIKSIALPDTTQSANAMLDTNPLLSIYHARLWDGVRLFYHQSIGVLGTEMKEILNPKPSNGRESTKRKKHKKRAQSTQDASINSGLEEMPAYELLKEWRANCRHWCCHLYAYATPTNEALQLIKQYAPLVELGAGTGYWSYLLQQQGVDIIAYDKKPTTTNNESAKGDMINGNEYHGQTPPFCSIAEGISSTVLLQDAIKSRNLFLCYPPPNDPMASECLQYFQGDLICHVGEWQGDTGDRLFEALLLKDFTLEHQLSLPNWGNSAYELTIWRRKIKMQTIEKKLSSIPMMSCFTCGKSSYQLKRCVVCKTNIYCTNNCAQNGWSKHAAQHAFRLIFHEDNERMEFTNENHFKSLLSNSDYQLIAKSSPSINANVTRSIPSTSGDEAPQKNFSFNFQP